MSAAAALDYDVVVPSVGRPSLLALLDSVLGSSGPPPASVTVVDDRRDGAPLDVPPGVRVALAGGRGPAAARNAGWRAGSATWVAFLDDDVVVAPTWAADLTADLAALPGTAGASQARLHVPLPAHRRPTDWERGTAGLERALWATADMAYRRSALETVGGFDEGFPRAYREDADLGLRVVGAGFTVERGSRVTTHPVRPAPWTASLRAQRGNADDARMRVKHGRGWRAAAQCGHGRLPWHAATTAGTLLMVLGRGRVRALGAATALALTLDFERRRIVPGPGDPAEILTMLVTSTLIPPVAVAHRLGGELRQRRRPAAVLFDRDGTLVHDVPYNGDPERVRVVEGSREALDRLRAAGVRVGVVSNQSGVARGLIDEDDVRAVNARIEAELGPIDVWRWCPHAPGAGCACRKPAPGLVLDAARVLGVDPRRCAVVGDIGTDVQAARAAGARGVLVPTSVTRREETEAAREVVPDLGAAVDLLLGVGR